MNIPPTDRKVVRLEGQTTSPAGSLATGETDQTSSGVLAGDRPSEISNVDGQARRRLLILGTGGGVHDVFDIVEAINAVTPVWQIDGFLDDSRTPRGRHLGIEVLGAIGDAVRLDRAFFINAIGSDRSFRSRPAVVVRTGLRADRFATLVHPSASVSSRARLGLGDCIGFGVSVGGGARIGDHVTLCPGCIIGHDADVGDYSVIAPGAVISGFVTIGRNCYVGARAVIRPGLHIGERALLGLGAVVTRDVEVGTTVLGCPARPFSRSDLPPV
jgi:sugar O-acyltransferase (sialic acid O-acetyltransferase NeuD family)